MKKKALISACGTFRYTLERRWDETLPTMVFIMLNPSTADAENDDHTIRKCIGFAERNRFGSIVVVNLFAFRSRHPKELRKHGFPVGPENDQWIRQICDDYNTKAGHMFVCAWGSNALQSRAKEVVALLRGEGVQPFALDLTRLGVPKHPLMLSYHRKPKEYNP